MIKNKKFWSLIIFLCGTNGFLEFSGMFLLILSYLYHIYIFYPGIKYHSKVTNCRVGFIQCLRSSSVCAPERGGWEKGERLHCVWPKQELFTSLKEISIMFMPRQQPKEEEAQNWP